MSQVDTRPLGRARGLSVFQKSHLTQLRGLGLARCRFWLEQIAKERASPVWGTSSKVLNSYLSQSQGEGLPPVSGLRMCGTLADWCCTFRSRCTQGVPATRVSFPVRKALAQSGGRLLWKSGTRNVSCLEILKVERCRPWWARNDLLGMRQFLRYHEDNDMPPKKTQNESSLSTFKAL